MAEMFPKSKISIVYALYKCGELRGVNVYRNIQMLYFLSSYGNEYLDSDDASQIVANVGAVVDLVREEEYTSAESLLDSIWSNLSETNGRLIRDITGQIEARHAYRRKSSNHGRYGSYGYVDYNSYSGYDLLDSWGVDMHDLGYD